MPPPNLWLHSALAVIATAAGVMLGRRLSRLPGWLWLFGYVPPLIGVIGFAVVRRMPELAASPPFSWYCVGRIQFIVFAGLASVLLTTPLSRIPRRRDRSWIISFLVLAVGVFGIGPLLLPAVMQRQHLALPTTVDPDGVCRQPDSYHCGPAASVTALGWLGINARLGDLSIRALTTSLIGTPPDLLCQAVEEQHGAEGVRCQYRRFGSLDEVPRHGVTVAVVKFALLVDHYVAIKEVTPERVVVGDPLRGLRAIPRQEFIDSWRQSGVVVWREPRS